MTVDVAIRCSCGSVEGRARGLSPKSVNRMVCHCRTCVAYPGLLGAAEGALDPYGGANIFQMAPANFTIDMGIEHIACLRLTPKGVLRWYAECCQTPIANTLAKPGVPLLGVLPSCLDLDATGSSLDDVLGPIRARTNAQLPRDQVRQLAGTKTKLFSMLLHYSCLLISWRLQGKHRPFVFFDAATRRPIRAPRFVDPNAATEGRTEPVDAQH